MSVLMVMIAGWLFAGRAALFGLVSLTPGASGKTCTPLFAFTAGLVATPLIAAFFSFTTFGFTGTLAALFVIDSVGLLWLAVRIRRRGIRLSVRVYGLLLWTALVMVLSWLNGPLIEHLSDAWWHMRNISTLVYQDSLLLPGAVRGGFDTLRDFIGTLGTDYSSYRLQAVLAWVSGSSIADSWIASTVAISGILAVSVYLLFHYLRLDALALCFCLVLWLVLLGGMNTATRLTGWPAGMGYVFLNIALIASYQLYCSATNRSAWLLLFSCIAGAAFFHLAEVFLLAVALVSLCTARLLFVRATLGRSLLALGALGAVLATVYLPVADSTLATLPALITTGGLILSLWLIGVVLSRNRSASGIVMALILAGLAGSLVVDWHHVLALFQPSIRPDPGYYGGYIPRYLGSWDGRPYLLPRWEHQLRAALLWSGVASLLLVLWLYCIRQTRLHGWLLVLTVAPWIVLTSPGLFTLISAHVPIYGPYRVQFLMPAALVLGVAAATAWRELGTAFNRTRAAFRSSKSFELNAIISVSAVNGTRTINAIGVVVGIACLYLVALQLLGNFSPTRSSLWIWLPLFGAGICIAFGMLSAGSVIACTVLILCLGVAWPDFGVRTGLVANRPWAIHSNLAFHWRLTNNRDALRTHTGWRYQNDLASIQTLIAENPVSWFVSDMATSYYAAAETQLRPVVQQAHHSNYGKKYNMLLRELCDASITGTAYLERLGKLGARQGRSVADSPKYVIVNRDTQNYTAEVLGESCVGETNTLASTLMTVAQPVFKGEYLTLWKLLDEPPPDDN